MRVTDKRNTKRETCANCGAQGQPGELMRAEEWGYDWDNPDEDAQGSVQVLLSAQWQHPTGNGECIETAIHMGHNYDFIRAVALDKSVPADVRERARVAYNEMVEAMRGVARASDLAAREQGYGVIGGPRGGNE